MKFARCCMVINRLVMLLFGAYICFNSEFFFVRGKKFSPILSLVK